MKRLGPIEIFLIEFIFFTLLWLMSEYTASLITIIFIPIVFFLLVVSLIAEMIERSKVPKLYFGFMIISIITPALVAFIFAWMVGMNFDWMQG